ncbi:MAG: hypothetical protein H6Q89_3107 [Myxococcaceae bacterium]|nr:hypothetical protein [Myxococcaceae bacterium]
MRNRSLSWLLLGACAISFTGCSSGNGGTGGGNGGGSGGAGGGSGGGAGNAIRVTGKMDNGSVTLAARESPLRRILSRFAPYGTAHAAGVTVDNVLAVSHDGAFVEAVKNGSTFSLTLERGKLYVVALLNGTTIVGLYKTDPATDMDAFPVGAQTTDLDLGSVSLADGGVNGTIASTELLAGLGLTPVTATGFGAMDQGLLRLASIDVDGNGVLDFKEKKYFSLKIGTAFASSDSFASLVGSWSNKANVSFTSYGFMFLGCPDEPALDWAQARLHVPQSLTICSSGNCAATTQPGINDELASTNDVIQANAQSCRHLNFFFANRSAIAPLPPPAGTYAVNVGARAFTFRYVATPDMSDMQNVYVPALKLTTAATGAISLIEWQWWKKRAGVWSQPTEAELALVLERATVILGRPQWAGDPNTDRLSVPMALTVNGSVVPAAHPFTPGVLMVNLQDKAAYDYSFDFR